MKNKDLIRNEFENQFSEIVSLIEKARSQALSSVNKELIDLYWMIGKYISEKIQKAEWGLM